MSASSSSPHNHLYFKIFVNLGGPTSENPPEWLGELVLVKRVCSKDRTTCNEVEGTFRATLPGEESIVFSGMEPVAPPEEAQIAQPIVGIARSARFAVKPRQTITIDKSQAAGMHPDLYWHTGRSFMMSLCTFDCDKNLPPRFEGWPQEYQDPNIGNQSVVELIDLMKGNKMSDYRRQIFELYMKELNEHGYVKTVPMFTAGNKDQLYSWSWFLEKAEQARSGLGKDQGYIAETKEYKQKLSG